MLKRKRVPGCLAEAVLENAKTTKDAMADRGGLSIVVSCSKASLNYYQVVSNNSDESL